MNNFSIFRRQFGIRIKRCFIFFFFYVSIFFTSKAAKIDSLQVSLLTVMPYGNKVYTFYGHSALRIYNPEQNLDIVFNWGTFDFDTPCFLYRFLKGKTNYYLSTTNYYQFIQCYNLLKATVIEQILYLPPKGKEYLLQMLSTNLHPKNRVYHYNFLKDNCTTRIRNLIEKTIENPLTIVDSTNLSTIRQSIHSYTYTYPWTTFGIDLLIGSEADKPISKQKELFFPIQLKKAVDSFIYSSGNPLVISSRQILQSNNEKNIHSSYWNSPMRIGGLILCIYGMMIAIIIKICKYQKSRIVFNIFRITKICSALLFLSATVIGCLILFLVLFSDHPCTSSNWNLLWLHPLHFVAFIGYFFRKSFYLITMYHWFNLIALFALFLGKSWFPQDLNPAIIPYIFCLILASSSYLICKKWLK